MTYSTPIRGTGSKKTKLNWWEYWIGHCWMTGWQSIHSAFKIWRDLITENFADYGILASVEDPFTECYEWFWVSLGEDDTYPKFFLEDLMEMCDRIDRGEEELIPMDEDFFKGIEDLVKDVKLDDNEKLNEIYRDTWPNLGWASKKDDAPWLNTTYDGFMTHEEMLGEAERHEKDAYGDYK